MTERQKQIVRSIVLGASVQTVAMRLSVRPQTVRRHLTNVFDETGTWSQPQLVGWCVAHGVVSVEDLQEVYCRGEMGAGPVGEPQGPAAAGSVSC